jgi:hypothetical protein
MERHATTWRAILRCATAVLIGAGGLVAVATAAQAHDGWHWKKGRYFVPPGHVYYAPPVVYAPRPVVVYRPPPVVYAPEPMYYGPPASYYGPPPGLNLNFNIPLR